MKRTIEYDNDTDQLGGFYEWWTVNYGDRSFRCSREQDAYWLAHLIELRDTYKPTTEPRQMPPAASEAIKPRNV